MYQIVFSSIPRHSVFLSVIANPKWENEFRRESLAEIIEKLLLSFCSMFAQESLRLPIFVAEKLSDVMLNCLVPHVHVDPKPHEVDQQLTFGQ